MEVILLNSYPLTVVKILTVRECSYGAITQTAHELYSLSLPIVLSHNIRYSFCKVICLIPCKKNKETFFSTENCNARVEKEE